MTAWRDYTEAGEERLWYEHKMYPLVPIQHVILCLSETDEHARRWNLGTPAGSTPIWLTDKGLPCGRRTQLNYMSRFPLGYKRPTFSVTCSNRQWAKRFTSIRAFSVRVDNWIRRCHKQIASRIYVHTSYVLLFINELARRNWPIIEAILKMTWR